MKTSELIKILKKDGWRLTVHGANHDFYCHSSKPGTLTIPRHASQEIATGTLNRLLKDAGVK